MNAEQVKNRIDEICKRKIRATVNLDFTTNGEIKMRFECPNDTLNLLMEDYAEWFFDLANEIAKDNKEVQNRLIAGIIRKLSK